MSSICRICFSAMPKDRKGWEQVCPNCKKIGHEELLPGPEEKDNDE